MPRKLKVTELKDEPISYDDVVKETETPEPEQPSVKEEIEPLVEVEIEQPLVAKPKKDKVTCEQCGKSMTAKNLKYAHHLVCTVANASKCCESEKVEETPDIIVEQPPTPLKDTTPVKQIRRKSNKIEKPEGILKKPSGTPPRKSKAVEKAEKYEQLVANAL